MRAREDLSRIADAIRAASGSTEARFVTVGSRPLGIIAQELRAYANDG